jgi:GT2 family glycosyltransferase
MAVFDIIPYSLEKNLGKAYNDAMALIPDGDHVCFRDGDTCWLTPDYGVHLAEYVRLYPYAILTCWTNRINEKAEQQHIIDRDNCKMDFHIRISESMKGQLYQTTPIHGFVSGFCMVIPKSVWLQHKFAEKQVYEDRGPHNLLGVDNDFTNRVRAAGVPVLRMDGLYIWHTYRLLDNSKNHLM